MGRELPVQPRSVQPARSDDYFEVTGRNIPPGSVPIVDDLDGVVTGHQRVVGGNTWTYDINGNVVGIHEPGLGTPLLDPTDLIFVVGALGRVALWSLFRLEAEEAGALAT